MKLATAPLAALFLVAAVCVARAAEGETSATRTTPAPSSPPATSPAAPATHGVLDGQTFVGQLGEKGKPKGDPDTLTFAGGQFHSSSCDAYGFGKAAYETATTGKGVVFSSETTSAKEGKMVWTGKVKDHTLTGKALWTKPGQSTVEYWVKAEITH